MLNDAIFPNLWLQLPPDTRYKLAEAFGLKKSSGVVTVTVHGQTKVECDGHTAKDLSAISREKMSDYLGGGQELDKKTMAELLDMCAEKVMRVAVVEDKCDNDKKGQIKASKVK